MIPRNLLTLWAAVLVVLPACTGLTDRSPDEVASSPAVEVTPSSTPIVWFPPTETATAAPPPIMLPTAEPGPGIGQLLVEDSMTSAAQWDAAVEGNAAATVSARGLSLSAEPGRPTVVSLHRSAVFDDMYLEVTARPNLCRGKDAYGVVFRAPNNVAHYRFAAVCDGTAAAERFSLGTPRVLQPPMLTSDVPVGAPGQVRFGVWANGSEFRFFLNDRFQFSVTDKNYASGGIGVFVEARAESPVLVTFSDLRVHGLLPTEPAVTASP